MSGSWFWCLEHGQVEEGRGCPNDRRLGPYDTYEEAADAITRTRERTEQMERADEQEREWGKGWDGS
ncbi:hypothetical protein EF847_14645 [Actinobacteria bacterium YIM 96077]|uniref:SPOR domain-containing protein n=1 Tax=Phytoactinopolyspora halophila TaxID=1981511 RepID=A0A329QB60_9ACTN|nr:hypothetical protein [Phytoactinopolyspora halophila]AYY13746.1 hypothetical protein EF847_14645 [Actinobacteria bacterium YIM 96077]RAW09477.1 hypothetical protein DPM12_21115 [Phytoactinopolyspora halophila]